MLPDTGKIEQRGVNHLKKAIWVGNVVNDTKKHMCKNPNKNKPVVVKCNIEVRSEGISKSFLKKHKQVYHFYGRIFEWS